MQTSDKSARILRFITSFINVVMVVAVYFAITNNLFALALGAFAASKWRIFAARPRLWFRNLVNSAVDVSFGLGVIYLMQFYLIQSIKITKITALLSIVLFVWQLFVRPRNSEFFVRLQALASQFIALVAIWTAFDASPNEIYGIIPIILTIIVSYGAANHVLRQYKAEEYEEELTGRLSTVWAFVVAQIAWLNWLWTVVYVVPVRSIEFIIPQISIVVSLVGYYIFSIFVYQPGTRTSRSYLALQTLWVGALLFAILYVTEWNSSVLN